MDITKARELAHRIWGDDVHTVWYGKSDTWRVVLLDINGPVLEVTGRTLTLFAEGK